MDVYSESAGGKGSPKEQGLSEPEKHFGVSSDEVALYSQVRYYPGTIQSEMMTEETPRFIAS